jgi:hypothetical protein
MKKISNILSQDERILGRARLHWIYMAKGLLWLITISGTGLFFDHLIHKEEDTYFFHPDMTNLIGHSIIMNASEFAWLCVGAGVLVFLLYYFKYISTLIWVTNKRLIYKTD